MMSLHRSRLVRFLIVLVAAMTLAASVADARAGRSGGGGGIGSRGARTYQTPPSTPTAPRPAAPVERSQVEPGNPAVNPGFQQRPMASPAAPGGFFGSRGGLMGGLFGAGLLGMLLGYGLAGGLGGIGSFIGLLLQLALIGGLIWLAVRLFQQRRGTPAHAGAGAAGAGAGLGAGSAAGAGPILSRDARVDPTAGLAGAAGGAAAARASGRPGRDELRIGQADLDTFERLLGELQAAYGREDAAALRGITTPELAGYLEQELSENRARGVQNHVRDVRLLQGDLAESWREGTSEYATVAMRFGLIDYTTERATGRVVEGDPNQPTEATEVWTFVRPRGGQWRLSAIQPV